MTTATLVKISFRVEPDRSRGIVSETLWAEHVGGNRFRLANTPFLVRGVSYRDVVFGRCGRHGVLTFAGVSLRGGHSTCWLDLRAERDTERFRTHWAQLHALGCSYEGNGQRSYAVDIPPSADFAVVEAMLEAGVASRIWAYEVSHRGHFSVGRPDRES
jgi:hypothetical protein